jgi:hypothetical protein
LSKCEVIRNVELHILIRGGVSLIKLLAAIEAHFSPG